MNSAECEIGVRFGLYTNNSPLSSDLYTKLRHDLHFGDKIKAPIWGTKIFELGTKVVWETLITNTLSGNEHGLTASWIKINISDKPY